MLSAFKRSRLRSRRVSILVLISDFKENVSAVADSFFRVDSLGAPCVAVSVTPRHPLDIGIRGASARRERPGWVDGDFYATGNDFNRIGVSVTMQGMRVYQDFISVKNGRSLAASFPVPSGSGPSTGTVTLETGDPFAPDNTRYFARGAGASYRVMIIGDSSQSFPIAAALRTADERFWSPIILKKPETASFDDIDSSDIIILSCPTYLPRPLQMTGQDPGVSGKVIIVSPSPDEAGVALTEQLARRFDKSAGFENRGVPQRRDAGCIRYRFIALERL